jgi:hypothetical protein
LGRAEVIARHTNLDLVLIWIPPLGARKFVQPITTPKEGQTIF